MEMQAIFLLVPEIVCLTFSGIIEPLNATAKAAPASAQTLFSSGSVDTQFKGPLPI